MSFRYLLIDMNTTGVLCELPSKLSLIGVSNIVHETLPVISSTVLSPHWPDREAVNQQIYSIDLKNYQLKLVDETISDENFLKKRNLSISKGLALYYLEEFCNCLSDYTCLGPDRQVYSDIEFELLSLPKENGLQSNHLLNYSEIVGRSIQESVSDLKLRVESAKAIRIRNLAIYHKYFELIQRAPVSDLDKIKSDFFNTVILNSYV